MSGSWWLLVSARRYRAQLIWRLPPRSRRWRFVLPELAGIGADRAMRASFASVGKRVMPAISPTSLAAIRTPQPRSASSRGAAFATRGASSDSSSLIVRVSSRMRRSSSRAILTRAVCSARASRPASRSGKRTAIRPSLGSSRSR